EGAAAQTPPRPAALCPAGEALRWSPCAAVYGRPPSSPLVAWVVLGFLAVLFVLFQPSEYRFPVRLVAAARMGLVRGFAHRASAARRPAFSGISGTGQNAAGQRGGGAGRGAQVLAGAGESRVVGHHDPGLRAGPNPRQNGVVGRSRGRELDLHRAVAHRHVRPLGAVEDDDHPAAIGALAHPGEQPGDHRPRIARAGSAAPHSSEIAAIDQIGHEEPPAPMRPGRVEPMLTSCRSNPVLPKEVCSMKDARLVLVALGFGAALLASAAPARAASSRGTGADTQTRTLRVDYFHTGNATTEMFALDRVAFEPLPWAGNPRRPFDDTNLGLYFFEVVDRETNRAIYSRGFASIFGEWQTTDEAKERWGTFSESFRFPAPERPVRISLKKRDAKNDFHEIWSLAVDPAGMFVDTSVTNAPAALLSLETHGDPSDKVDLLILGDGYTKEERPKFEKDARRMIGMLFGQEPFKSHRGDFNVWGLSPAAAESGISRPSTGIHRRNPVGGTYDAFGSERYVLTFDNRAFREAAQFAPYDFVEILVNGNTYGGGGIFGLYSTVAADSAWAPYVFVHEFGHHFAGLADEYYTSDVATDASHVVEPWERNATANGDPATIKWKA